jgi:hypothetical protein
MDGFCGRLMCFLNSGEEAELEQKEPLSSLKQQSCRKDAFKNQPRISQGNNMLEAVASNIDGLLGELRVFLQLSLISLFGGKRLYVHFETCKLRKYSFQ